MTSNQYGLAAARPSTPAAVSTAVASGSAEAPRFDRLGLTPDLLRTVAAQGYTEPTPVQAQAIPIVLSGRDLLAGAQTGTGKTAAFVLPILQLLNASRPEPRPLTAGRPWPRGSTGLPIRCLVLSPTRELALQIEESVRTYGAARPIRSTAIYGGVGFQPQVHALRGGPEIVVATPGRLLDHVGQGTIDLSSVQILVLDEADRMLDMGFIRDIRRIIALLPERRQNLLFSATFSDDIRELAAGLLHDPAYVQIARNNAAVELVRQVVYPVDRERKRELLSHLVRTGRIDRALVFTRTKHGANRLAEQLGHDGILASAIHGNKSQGQRVRALDDFKAGRVAILVATEVASRGLDIDGLPHVVNYELPTVPADYVHRIGRTGRAGMEGDAVSLVCIDEGTLLGDIEALLRQQIRREVVPGFEVDPSIRREPIRQRSGEARPARRAPAPAHRQSVAPAHRQSVAPAHRQSVAPSAPRRAAESSPRYAPQSASRHAPQSAPRHAAEGGFNTHTPIEPRRNPTAAFRRPVPDDFSRSAPVEPSIGYAPARRPGGSGFSANRGFAARPTRAPGNDGRPAQGRRSGPRPAQGSGPAGKPVSGAYRQGERGHATPRVERQASFVAMPGERIARNGNRPG